MPAPAPRYHANPPAACDLCDAAITVGFSDAAIKIGPRQRTWANVCPLCALQHDARYGTGMGQRYERDDTGRFAKVEG
jgi:hypothetical protein